MPVLLSFFFTLSVVFNKDRALLPELILNDFQKTGIEFFGARLKNSDPAGKDRHDRARAAENDLSLVIITTDETSHDG